MFFAADSSAETMGKVNTLVWIALPVALGFVAIYSLLPRAGRKPASLGIALGGVSLVLGAWLLVPSETINIETVLFYSFSALAVIGGVSLVTHANPVHAALSFALVILSTCGLFLLLAAPFLMAATIIIYAGAIIVTFLFVIMLAQQSGLAKADQHSREPVLATIAGGLLLVSLLFVLHSAYRTDKLARLVAQADELSDQLLNENAVSESRKSEAAKLAEGFREEAYRFLRSPGGMRLREESENLDTGRGTREMADSLQRMNAAAKQIRRGAGMLEPAESNRDLSNFSGPPANQEPRRDDAGRPQLPADNVAYLGRSLFTDYLIPVELGGTLLLVATIGAIAITHRRPEGTA